MNIPGRTPREAAEEPNQRISQIGAGQLTAKTPISPGRQRRMEEAVKRGTFLP
jgi:hypothetical protein